MWGAERLSSRDEKILVGVWGGLRGESGSGSTGHTVSGEPPDHNHHIHNHAPLLVKGAK